MEKMKDAMITIGRFGFPWRTRVVLAARILFGWELDVRAKTPTEHVIGRTGVTAWEIAGVAPRWWRRLSGRDITDAVRGADATDVVRVVDRRRADFDSMMAKFREMSPEDRVRVGVSGGFMNPDGTPRDPEGDPAVSIVDPGNR